MPAFIGGNASPHFPPVEYADEDGLLAVGGKLNMSWLLEAYAQGIFPWFNQGDPVLWWCPDPRFVLYPEQVQVSRSMKSVLRNAPFEFTLDRAFPEVMECCGDIRRKGQHGTWITSELKEAYHDLHKIGAAHSAETWHEGKLVGGLYGVAIGSVFFGESMFAKKSNASKYAFVKLCEWLAARKFEIIDCQVHTSHLERLGAKFIKRHEFLAILKQALTKKTEAGIWKA
jgi:leucyl/phenylalanyl-tRNA--protein transferase